MPPDLLREAGRRLELFSLVVAAGFAFALLINPIGRLAGYSPSRKNLPPRADDRDRAKFAKAQSYMLRRDDMMVCKNIRCRKRFEITGVQSVAFLG
jgi:hypothetical protein